MATKIKVTRLTRFGEKAEGVFRPLDLPRLKPFLAGAEGEIRYLVTGSEATDANGGRVARVKCIILGWFLLSDPETFEPDPYELGIESVLIPVSDESLMPPLEDENENEDFVVMGEDLDIAELVEEEILLDLPFWAVAAKSKGAKSGGKGKAGKAGKSGVAGKTGKATGSKADEMVIENGDSADSPRPSPFAKLAALKKVH
jgi:hypothetical protein